MELKKETVLTFGKYKGKCVDELLEKDPSYLEWMVKNIEGAFLSPDVNTILEIDKVHREMASFMEYRDLM